MTARLVRTFFWVALVAIPVAVGLFRVWVHHDAVESGYALSKEEGRRQELRRTNEQLRVELAAERSPERLAQRAAKLGLTAPAPRQVYGAHSGGRHE
jgi:hypothetical protein